MEVRNLFFNTPVRRTFLKSDSTEAGHVAETFCRIALAHPEVHLTFRSGGKIVHDLPPVTGMRERIAIFFGRELAESLLWVEGRLDQIHLWGYVAHPSQSRSTQQGPVPLPGGPLRSRPVAGPCARRGLSRAADGRAESRRVPPPGDPPRGGRRQRPSDQDRGPVPRSPARLQPPALDAPPDVSLQRSALAASGRAGAAAGGASAGSPSGDCRWRTGGIGRSPPGGDARRRERARRTSCRPGPRTVRPSPAGSSRDRPVPGDCRRFPTRWAGSSRPNGRSRCPAGSSSPPRRSSTSSRAASAASAAHRAGGPRTMTAMQRNRVPVRPRHALVQSSLGPPALKAIQVHDSYLIAETTEGMMVIDQHALHERILYEELRQRVAGREGGVAGPARSRAGSPERGRGRADPRSARAPGRAWAWRSKAFGGDTVLVRSTPVMLSHLAPDRLLRDLAEHLHTPAAPAHPRRAAWPTCCTWSPARRP